MSCNICCISFTGNRLSLGWPLQKLYFTGVDGGDDWTASLLLLVLVVVACNGDTMILLVV
jgi:hypothetical protein